MRTCRCSWLAALCVLVTTALCLRPKGRVSVSVHLSSGRVTPSLWSLWRLEFKCVVPSFCFHWTQEMVGGFPPSPSASGRPFLGLPKSTHKHRVLAYVIMDSVHLCISFHPYIHTYQVFFRALQNICHKNHQCCLGLPFSLCVFLVHMCHFKPNSELCNSEIYY